MSISKTTEGIYKLTTNIEDILFEGLWEIPNGVSLNSFVVKGEKTAIIDGFCGWDGVPKTFFNMLEEMDVALETIDYIVINHMEPDHSGWIEEIKALKKDVTIVCTKASEKLLDAFYSHRENIHVVKNGEELDLGGGRVLQFYAVPNVHWPDAMVTFDTLSGTLFSCDAFGSYGIVEDEGYDDTLTPEKEAFFESEAVRYYSNIVAAFSNFTQKAIDKCEPLPVKIVAPGHGLVWRKNPDKIIEDYKRYAAYQKGPAKKEVTIIWGSMYGMTEKGVKRVVKALEDYDIKVNIHEVPKDSWGTVLASAWTSTGIILAMPTYENKMFPPMAAMLDELGKKKVQNRVCFRIGSYGWSGGAEKELAEIMERQKMGWTFLPKVEFNGSPTEEDFIEIDNRIKEFIEEVDSRF